MTNVLTIRTGLVVSREARREGLPAAADLRKTEQVSPKPRRVRRIARAIPGANRNRATQRKGAQSGKRDAVSRLPRGRAATRERCRLSAEAAAGNHSRESAERSPARMYATRDASPHSAPATRQAVSPVRTGRGRSLARGSNCRDVTRAARDRGGSSPRGSPRSFRRSRCGCVVAPEKNGPARRWCRDRESAARQDHSYLRRH